MTGYWCTVGWCRCARGCGHDIPLPCACPTPYHPVILAQARIHTYPDASLDSSLRRMTGYWCTVGWCGCKCRSVRECRRDMSRPYDYPTPYQPVILAQARIPTYSDASLDSCLRRMTGYWCTAGWCRCKCRSVRECRRDMSRPYDCPTPYHPVILAQARIHTNSDASLDSCLRRNDGLLVHCWLVQVQVQVQVRARVPPRHVAPLRLPNALPPRHPRAGEDPYVL